MSAAFESICESTSHKETISTGDTCTSRNRSDFPYHPQPIKPTRRRLSRSYSCAGATAAAANPRAVVYRNSRRFIGIPAKRKQFSSIFLRINHDRQNRFSRDRAGNLFLVRQSPVLRKLAARQAST